MNNFVIGLKRFFKNKNVVTVLLVILILVVLYIGYSGAIKSQTNPVQVPVASQDIAPETQITGDYIVFKSVASSMVGDQVIRNSGELIGKYTALNVTVPEGSVFYKSWITEAENIPGNWIEQLNGKMGYYLNVDMTTTLGNSVLPNSYIDLYLKATDENGTVIFGKLIKNAKVLVVHDASGNNVFNNTEGYAVPSKIGFAVEQDVYTLLKKAEYLNLDLVLAPRGYTVPAEDSVIVTSSALRDYIDAKAKTEEEDIITTPTPGSGS